MQSARGRLVRSFPWPKSREIRQVNAGALGTSAWLGTKALRERGLMLGMIAARLVSPYTKLATTRQWHSTSFVVDGMDGRAYVRSYEALANVECAFRSLKTIDLKVRPIHHRTAKQVSTAICASASASSCFGLPGRASSCRGKSSPPCRYAVRVRQLAVRPIELPRPMQPLGSKLIHGPTALLAQNQPGLAHTGSPRTASVYTVLEVPIFTCDITTWRLSPTGCGPFPCARSTANGGP